MSLKVTTLSNGLRVISDPMPGLETAAVGVWVDTGARHETVAENGISHVLEHMAFKGTEKRTALEIAEVIEAVGGHLNAYTSRDQTAYFARVLKADVPLAVDILGDILQHSSFDDTELGREKEVIVQEIGQTHDTPDDIIFDHLQETAYPDQPLGRSILGTSTKVRGFGRDTIAGYMKKRYLASKMVLSASGAIDHDELVRLAEQAFSELPTDGAINMEGAIYKGGEFLEDRELEQIHFALSVPGVAYGDDDFYTSQILSGLLGGGMSSRLFQELRERRGLCYSVFSFASSFADTGLFTVYAGTGEDQIDELGTVLADELLRVTGGILETEVNRAKAQHKAAMLMGQESPASRSEVYARQMLIFDRTIPAAESIANIDAVSTARVQELAGRLFTSVTPTIAAIGPLKSATSFASMSRKLS